MFICLVKEKSWRKLIPQNKQFSDRVGEMFNYPLSATYYASEQYLEFHFFLVNYLQGLSHTTLNYLEERQFYDLYFIFENIEVGKCSTKTWSIKIITVANYILAKMTPTPN